MKLSARSAACISVAWLLPFLLTGCFHRTHQAKSQPVAPPLSNPTINTVPVEPPASANTIPAQPTETAKAPAEQEHHRPRVRHHKPRPQPAAPHQEVASAGVPAVSAIGQLSSGDPLSAQRQTEDFIVSIDKALNGIHRPLNDAEQKTAEHIREFLKQARAALASGDVDGARTLAAKAKVLLTELMH